MSEIPEGTAPRLQVEAAESTTNATETPQMQRKDSLTVPTVEVDAVDGAVFTRSSRRGSVRASVRQMQLPGNQVVSLVSLHTVCQTNSIKTNLT